MAKPPMWWYGGKTLLAPWILQYLPRHSAYVELFGGSGAVLLAKTPCALEVFNDLDHGLVNFYRVLRNPDQYRELQRRLSAWPWSRAEYHWARQTWGDPDDPVERAARWFAVARQSFSGAWGRSWSFNTSPDHVNATAWLHAVTGLAEVHHRLRQVQVECVDWARCLDLYDRPEALVYADPPYVHETRDDTARQVYAVEMTLEDHDRLAERLLQARGMVVLSGYRHPVYAPLERAGWRRVDHTITPGATARTMELATQGQGGMAKRRRRESLWLSPSTTQHLAQQTFWEE